MSAMPYAVELNGSLSYFQQGVMETPTDLSHIRGDCTVVTDFEDGISRAITVEADTRYVELMISRKLQETGEFDEPVTVITHWKKKRSKNTTDIFFTALRATQYYRYLELVAENSGHLILLPLQTILLTMLRKYASNQPVAAVFQHDRFADILIGTRQKIMYANRVVAFDNSDEQMKALWETVRADLEAFGNEHRRPVQTVYTANWIDSWRLPQWDGEDSPRVVPVEEVEVATDDGTVQASLPVLIQQTSAKNAVASRREKLFLAARRMLPWCNAAMLLAALVLGGAAGWYAHQAEGYAANIESLQSAASQMRLNIPKGAKAVDYKPTLEFVERLWRSRSLPTYSQILHDTRQGTDGGLKIENIDVKYSDDSVAVKAFGSVTAPFERAHKGYRSLINRLKRRGYTILDERFDTRINASSFLVHFTKELR